MFSISLFEIGINYFWTPILQLGALYLITIIDKVDGEVARISNYHSQKGMYYDRFIHSVYPIVLYFVIAWYFFIQTENVLVFGATLILAILTSRLESFPETKEFIKKKIKREEAEGITLQDYGVASDNSQKTNIFLPFRILYYTTFMVYAWTIFYYLVLLIVSNYSFEVSLYLYYLHLAASLLVVGYRVLYSFPRKKVTIY